MRQSALQRKIDGEGDESDDRPPDIVGKGHTEVPAGIGVVIDLAEEPAVATERHRIDHHVDEGKQASGQDQHGPPGPGCEVET